MKNTTLINTNWGDAYDTYVDSAIENIADNNNISVEEILENKKYYETEIDDTIEFMLNLYEREVREQLDDWGRQIDGFIIRFSLGLWNGRFDGFNICESYDEAMRKLLKDYYDYSIEYEDGHLSVANSHHDGTNYYQVYPITRDGLDLYDDWCRYDEEEEKYKGVNESDIIKRMLKEYTDHDPLEIDGNKYPFYYSEEEE